MARRSTRSLSEPSRVDLVLELQETIGNTATQAVLARQDDDAVATESPRDREVVRLEEEMLKLAKRNAWKGVRRKYSDIEERGHHLTKPQYHRLGAQAEMELVGATERYEEVLQRGVDAGDPMAKQDMEKLRTSYQKVRIRPGGFLGGIFKGRPTLVCPRMPFPPDERRTVEHAISVFDGSKRFDGFLPRGSYTLNDEPFEIAGGASTRELSY